MVKFIKKDNILQIMEDIEKDECIYAFISIVISSWHLDNLIVFLQEHKLSKGIIIVMPQSNINGESKHRLTELNFPDIDYSDCKIYILNTTYYKIFKRNIVLRFFKYSRVSKSLYLIGPGVSLNVLSIIPLKYERIKYVIIDEGTGSYMLPYIFRITTYPHYSRDRKQFLFWDYLKSYTIELLKQTLIKITRITVINYLMFNKTEDRLIPNSIICKSLYNYYARNRRKCSVENNIVFFKDFNVWEGESLIGLYIELFDYISSLKIKLIIKKHPNDSNSEWFDKMASKYKYIDIIQYHKSGEQLIADYMPRCIIGGYSTAVFTIPFIFNINTYSYMLKYKNYEELPSVKRKFIDSFYKQFRIQELILYLSMILRISKYRI